jgi:hypothetical protein
VREQLLADRPIVRLKVPNAADSVAALAVFDHGFANHTGPTVMTEIADDRPDVIARLFKDRAIAG